jgi:hypothetical protein
MALAWVVARLLAMADWKEGTAIAASMATTEMVTASSISVNPLFFIVLASIGGSMRLVTLKETTGPSIGMSGNNLH